MILWFDTAIYCDLSPKNLSFGCSRKLIFIYLRAVKCQKKKPWIYYQMKFKISQTLSDHFLNFLEQHCIEHHYEVFHKWLWNVRKKRSILVVSHQYNIVWESIALYYYTVLILIPPPLVSWTYWMDHEHLAFKAVKVSPLINVLCCILVRRKKYIAYWCVWDFLSKIFCCQIFYSCAQTKQRIRYHYELLSLCAAVGFVLPVGFKILF